MEHPEASITEQAEKKEQIYKKVFVELGTHYIPLPMLGNKKFLEDELYIGIDIRGDLVKQAKQNTNLAHEGSDFENIQFLQADAKRLPLKNKAAEEILLGNVLGDPSISLTDKATFLEEAKRVITEEGVIVIKETNTPLERDILMKLLANHHLEMIKEVNEMSADWPDAIAPYEKMGAQDLPKYSRDSYLLTVKEIESK